MGTQTFLWQPDDTAIINGKQIKKRNREMRPVQKQWPLYDCAGRRRTHMGNDPCNRKDCPLHGKSAMTYLIFQGKE